MSFENTSSRFRSMGFLSPQPECGTRPLGSRYTHIVVPTSLGLDDRAVLLLGMEMAAAHQARLTVLHVLPPTEHESSANGLDAFVLLHRALDQIHHRPPSHGALDTGERTRLQVTEFLKRVVPEHQHGGVDVCVECRRGAIADSIARFAEEAAAELVIISTGVSRRWLPILPARVRRLLQLARQQIILVRPDARARHGLLPTPSDALFR